MSEPAGAARRRILDQATLLFVERGYHGIAMREIAAAVGLSKAALYYHFQDKEQLFLAILNSALDLLAEALPGADAAGGVEADLRGILAAILGLPAPQRAVVRLASSELAHLGPEAQAQFRQRYYALFIGRIEGALQAGIARGELRPLDLRMATWALLGMAYPFFAPGDQREAPPAALAQALAALFLDGARQPASG